MIRSHLYFLMIVLTATPISHGCKSKSPQPTPSITYDVTPPEILKDPNPNKDTVANDETDLNLNATNTPCVSQISTFGTVADRTWREAFSRVVMQRICGKDPSVAKNWRSSTQYNPDSWIAGVNLTAVTLNVPRGTAITPRHVVYTKHYGYHGQVGQKLNFMTMDNRIVSRYITGVKYLSTEFNPDIAVIQLDSDLPGSITPMKVFHPDATYYAAQFSPLLRIDQESKALIAQASPSGAYIITTNPNYNPPGGAFRLYYEDMITGDSSSPSILLMNGSNGVTPILFSLVTFAGGGQGPRLGPLVSQIQTAIQSLGDPHKIVTAPQPLAPIAAPTCSISASRISNSSSCALTVFASADPVTGNPSVSPSAPTSWTRSGNVWSGNAACSTTAATTFFATLSGQGGTGRSCESKTIEPLGNSPTQPMCNLGVTRDGISDNCTYTMTKTSGAVTAFTILGNTINWDGSNPAIGSLKCNQTTDTPISATITGPNGNSSCSAVAPRLNPPSCSLIATRLGASTDCTLKLVGSGVIDTSKQPIVSPSSSGTWNASDWAGTGPCSTTSTTVFEATIQGPGSAKGSCKSNLVPVATATPTRRCQATASRTSKPGSCALKVEINGDIIGNPRVTPYAPSSWSRSGSVWSAIVNCPVKMNLTYSVNVSGPGNTSWGCGSNKVSAITN